MSNVIAMLEFVWQELYSLGIDRARFSDYFAADLVMRGDVDERTARKIVALFEALGWTKAHPKAQLARSLVNDYKRADADWHLRRIDGEYVRVRDGMTRYQQLVIDGGRYDAYYKIKRRIEPLK